MRPSRRAQFASWALALAGVSLSYVNQLFFGLVVIALLLRPDLMAKDLFNRFASHHRASLSAALLFMAAATALLLWGLLYGGPQVLSQLGPNALWLCMLPVVLLLVIYEFQQFTGGSRTQPTAQRDGPASGGPAR